MLKWDDLYKRHDIRVLIGSPLSLRLRIYDCRAEMRYFVLIWKTLFTG